MLRPAIIVVAACLVLAGVWGVLQFYSPLQIGQRDVTRQFNDLLLEMKQDAAIQAGFVQTMHEQRWGNEAFLSILGIEIPLGKSEAFVRAPIRVYYGVRPLDIRAVDSRNDQLHLTIRKVDILSVDADISQLEIRTENGWARIDAIGGEEARTRAKNAFEQSKYHAADRMLQSLQVTADIRAALLAIAVRITGINDVYVERLDLPANGHYAIPTMELG